MSSDNGVPVSELSPPPHTVIGMLTDLDRAILAFERTRWKHQGAKESAIREEFGMSATVYYAELHRLLSDPEAEAVDAVLVRRLQRLRERRRGLRG